MSLPSKPVEANALEHDAMHDDLTGLLNRRGFSENLQHFIKEQPGRFGVLFIDLDNIKRINDTEGHDSGDQILIKAADVFRDTLRQQRDENEKDVVALGRSSLEGRIGGDEFVLLIPGTRTDEDLQVVEARLRNNLESAGIAASVGGAQHTDGTELSELMIQADDSMYADKERRKLAQYSPEQLRIVSHIGQLAVEHGLDLRDLPTLIESNGQNGDAP